MLRIFLALAAAAQVPQPLFRIPSEHRLIEGVASDGATVWASSVLDGAILACRRTCRPFAHIEESLHPLGMAWDASRQRLWVTADCPDLPPFRKCTSGALLGLDGRGRIRDRLQPAGIPLHAGDVSADRGHVFVSDSVNGAVYWLKPGLRSLRVLLPAGVGKSAQGSALDRSGKSLIIADYSDGIAQIDLETGMRTLLLRNDGRSLRGIDGMVRCGQQYVAVFNAEQPNALVAFNLEGQHISWRVLYSGSDLPAPTQLAFRGNQLLIAADGNWTEGLKPDGKRHGPYPLRQLPKAPLCQQPTG